MKYPGGYQIIDLGGITLEGNPKDLKPGTYEQILASDKPVLLSNFKWSGDLNGIIHSPLLLTKQITKDSLDNDLDAFFWNYVDNTGATLDVIYLRSDDKIHVHEI